MFKIVTVNFNFLGSLLAVEFFCQRTSISNTFHYILLGSRNIFVCFALRAPHIKNSRGLNTVTQQARQLDQYSDLSITDLMFYGQFVNNDHHNLQYQYSQNFKTQQFMTLLLVFQHPIRVPEMVDYEHIITFFKFDIMDPKWGIKYLTFSNLA